MKKLLISAFCLFMLVFTNAQENEFYRFSFSYFKTQLENKSSDKVYYLKEKKEWRTVEKKEVPAINNFSDWKIVDTVKNITYGAFSEGGVYTKCEEAEYCKFKNKWMHQYYKPIWEIKMSSIGFDKEYVMDNHSKSWLTDEELGEVVFDIPEITAEFPGGISNMYAFISKSITFPQVSAHGKVFVQFVVKNDGTISNIEVVRGVHKLIDEEVIRVIEEMPNWIPARQKGKLVNSHFILPVIFQVK